MNASYNRTDGAHLATALREYEDGASGRGFRDRQYGRRVEVDHSWTIYHVFTGIPAHVDGAVMTGLNHSDATIGMLSLNRRHTPRSGALSFAPGDPREPASQA